MGVTQARRFTPSMFMLHDPQMPSRHAAAAGERGVLSVLDAPQHVKHLPPRQQHKAVLYCTVLHFTLKYCRMQSTVFLMRPRRPASAPTPATRHLPLYYVKTQ